MHDDIGTIARRYRYYRGVVNPIGKLGEGDGTKSIFLTVVSPFLKRKVSLRKNGHAKRNKMSYFLGLGSMCGSS